MVQIDNLADYTKRAVFTPVVADTTYIAGTSASTVLLPIIEQIHPITHLLWKTPQENVR